MSNHTHLAKKYDRSGASRVTQRHAAVALLGVLALYCATSCATAGKPGMAATVDFVDAAGREGTLGAFAGKVVVLDVCASWATACNLNARVLDEVANALAAKGDRGVVLLTVLLDEGVMGDEAVRSYGETLGVKHPVMLAGPRLRAGTSILGAASYVPRVVIFDRTGAVRVDDSGGVINVEGMIARIEPLL